MTIAMAKYRFNDSAVQCPDCKGYYDPNENPGGMISEGRAYLTERLVCPNCVALAGYVQCAGCNEVYKERDLTDCDGRLLCDDCREKAGWKRCYSCDNYFHRDNLRNGADHNDYCEDCWNDRFDYCSRCDEVCYRDDMRCRDDNLYCSDCCSGNSNFDPAGFNGRDSYTKITSRRCFGVEIETDDCSSHEDLDGHPAWGAKDDCSVRGKEMYSDILYGDAGIEAIEELCHFADRNGWGISDDCGLHVHFDMRSESSESMKAIALAYVMTYDVWREFVDSDRVDNHYCREHDVTSSDIFGITNWRDFAYRITRYTWINFAAYNTHKTFEVRLHHGSLDSREICNWIKAHAAFMDWAANAGWAVVRNTLLCKDTAGRFDCMAQIWAAAGYADFAEYYRRKARFNRAGWAQEVAYA